MSDWFEKRIKPMLATKGKPFSSDEYLFEIKWDGTRCIAFVDVERKRIRMQNRRLMEIAYRYPELDFFDFLSENAVLDGEIVVLKDGKPSFQLLQQREHIDSKKKIELLAKAIPAVFMVFDVLYAKSDGWVMKQPLEERRKILRNVGRNTKQVAITDFIRKEGEAFYKKAVELGLEGVVAKKKDSIYISGKRSKSWIKIKKKQTADCIIVGWLEGEGTREGKFGSLILAMKKNRELIHVGQVGTGFDSEFINWFSEELKKIEISRPWFEAEFARKPHWVKPVYVCEVEFLEVTEDFKLRAPVFVRLRNDKNVEECRIDDFLNDSTH